MKLPPILLEDEAIVAFDKPSGLAVSGEGEAPGTLIAMARQAFGRGLSGVHRLDAEASGVVLFARTKVAVDFLSGQFQAKTVARVQHAVAARAGAEAPSASFSVDLAVGPDERDPSRSRVYKRSGGGPALTEFRVLETFGAFVWLECRPVTGRAHQVRLHAASAGLPIVGDALYGDPLVELRLSALKRGYKGLETEQPLVTRLALHASSVAFIHPGSRRSVVVEAPLPKDLSIALRNLRKFAGARGPSVRPRGPR
jgi:RluA family pseudouridine synthase